MDPVQTIGWAYMARGLGKPGPQGCSRRCDHHGRVPSEEGTAMKGRSKGPNERIRGFWRWLFAISVLIAAGGCIVQSLNPFYTPEAVIQMPQLNGEWILVQDYGDKPLPADTRWTFRDKEIETRDKRGALGPVQVVYFRVKDSLYADFAPGDPEKMGVNEYWIWTVAGVHTLCKVMLSEDNLTLLPLNYDWLPEQVEKQKAISLPFVRAEKDDELLFTATGAMWMSFLEKHGQHVEAFSTKHAFVLKRPKG